MFSHLPHTRKWVATSYLGFIMVLALIAMLVSDVRPALAQEKIADEQVAARARRLSALPPLEAARPLVGPLIKRDFSDDVNSWTTAFIPRSLDHLTPIEFPKGEDRWIRVDLSEQVVIAYENDKPIRGFVISSGLKATPTVIGTFRITTKVRSQTMTGGNPALGTYYNLPNVEWVQYFYRDYSFHGTYWHNNFGQPMSHGCLNMTNADAKWLFDWAGPTWDNKSTWFFSSPDNPGTLVIVHE